MEQRFVLFAGMSLVVYGSGGAGSMGWHCQVLANTR